MNMLRFVALSAFAIILSGPAAAGPRADFGGLAICSKLTAMPQSYRPTDCRQGAPLRGACRFTMVSNGMPIDYLIEDGVVLSKTVRLRSGARFTAPYRLQFGDSVEISSRKVKQGTGLSSRHWTDSEEPGASYLQSDAIGCSRSLSYTVYVWFNRGRATSVSISTLPAI